MLYKKRFFIILLFSNSFIFPSFTRPLLHAAYESINEADKKLEKFEEDCKELISYFEACREEYSNSRKLLI